MHLVLAAIGAAIVGTGDFAGGTASRRDSPHGVATFAFFVGTVFSVLLVPFFGGDPTATDLMWGAISGIGGALGVFTLYRGFKRAPMGLVSPIAGVVGAAVPVIGGLVLGEGMGTLTGAGLAFGTLAIVLVSISKDDPNQPGTRSSAIAHGVVTGIGFGILLLALALITPGAGLLPVAVSRLSSFALLALQGVITGRAIFALAGARLISAGAGVLTVSGNVMFYLAVGIGSVVASTAVYAMFPVATVIMARIVHGEHLTKLQMAGVALAVTAGVLLGMGSVAA